MKFTTRELQDPTGGQRDPAEGASGHLLAITLTAGMAGSGRYTDYHRTDVRAFGL